MMTGALTHQFKLSPTWTEKKGETKRLLGRAESNAMPKAILLTVAVVTLGCVGCDRVPGTEAYAVKAAEARVAAQLLDPASALFSDVRVFGGQHERICGLVNGRNRMGGYAGATRFVSTPSLTVLEPTDASDYYEVCLFEAATAFYCAEKLGPAIETAGC